MNAAALIVVGVAAWVAFGVLDAGFVFAYFQRQYPRLAERDRSRDLHFALWSLLSGPLGLVSTLVLRMHRHGWTLRGRS